MRDRLGLRGRREACSVRGMIEFGGPRIGMGPGLRANECDGTGDAEIDEGGQGC